MYGVPTMTVPMIAAEEVAEDMLRVGQLVSATSFKEEH